MPRQPVRSTRSDSLLTITPYTSCHHKNLSPLPVQKSKLCPPLPPPPPTPPPTTIPSLRLHESPHSFHCTVTTLFLPHPTPLALPGPHAFRKKEEKNPITCVAHSTDRLSGRMVKRFASRAEDWDQFPAFSGSHPVPVIKWPPLPDDWCQRISPRTGWPGVNIV